MSEPISGVEATASWLTGRQMERADTIAVINSRICFDFVADGTCDHSACWALHDLRTVLLQRSADEAKGENK